MSAIFVCSPDFRSIVEISLKKVVDMLVDDLSTQLVGMSPPSGVPLAKLLPRVSQLCLPLLDEPSSNKFVHTIGGLPDAELFYTLLYANMPIQS